MKSINIILSLILLSQFSFSQNSCGNFKDYKSSQLWINEIKQLNPNQKKTKILERIKCEQDSKPQDIDFWLTIVLDGTSVFLSNDIPEERNQILNLIPENNFIISNSLCEIEGIIYPQRCNLGYVIIKNLDKPIFNENIDYKNIILKRKKEKIVIIFKSKKKNKVALKITDFINLMETEKIKEKEVKKGKNRIVIKTDNKLKVIELESNEMKTIILK